MFLSSLPDPGALVFLHLSLGDLQIENAAYPVTVDALHTVFTPYGFVQKICNL